MRGINGQPVQRHGKGRNVILFDMLKKLDFLLSCERSEVYAAYTFGYHINENNNYLILQAQRHWAVFMLHQ